MNLFNKNIEYVEDITDLITYNSFQIKSVIDAMVESKKAVFDAKNGKVTKNAGISPDLWIKKYRVELHYLYEVRKILFTHLLGRVPKRKEIKIKKLPTENPFDYMSLTEKFKTLKFNFNI